MLFIYIRHGEPIYDPDSLTELGKQQAEDVARFLSIQGVDTIYSSTSNRAILTAMPTAKRLQKEIITLDFAHEKHPWKNLTIEEASGRKWLFQSHVIKELFHSNEIVELGVKWYEHPQFINTSYKTEMNRIQLEINRLCEHLGYLHVGHGRYKVIQDNDNRIAFFAHQGFGFAFLSLLLNIPYPTFCTHFDIGHAEITMIEFKNEDGYAYPKVLSFSNRAHLT